MTAGFLVANPELWYHMNRNRVFTGGLIPIGKGPQNYK